MNSRGKYKGIIKGMASENKLVQWETMLTWCQLWIEEENQKSQPLLELISQLKELGFWQKYYPSQSHNSLGLSLGKNYKERLELPMVYISYNSSNKSFAIQYQKGQGGETMLVDRGKSIYENDFADIENWLNSIDNNSREQINSKNEI